MPEAPLDPRLSSQGQCVQKRLRGTMRALSLLTEALGSGLTREDRTILEADIGALQSQIEMVSSRLGPEPAAAS